MVSASATSEATTLPTTGAPGGESSTDGKSLGAVVRTHPVEEQIAAAAARAHCVTCRAATADRQRESMRGSLHLLMNGGHQKDRRPDAGLCLCRESPACDDFGCEAPLRRDAITLAHSRPWLDLTFAGEAMVDPMVRAVVVGRVTRWLEEREIIVERGGIDIGPVTWHALLVANNLLAPLHLGGAMCPGVVPMRSDLASEPSMGFLSRAFAGQVRLTAADIIAVHLMIAGLRREFARDAALPKEARTAVPPEEEARRADFLKYDVLGDPASLGVSDKGGRPPALMAVVLRSLHGTSGADALLHWWLEQGVIGAAADAGRLGAFAKLITELSNAKHDESLRGADIAAFLMMSLLECDPERRKHRGFEAETYDQISAAVWKRFHEGGLAGVLCALWRLAAEVETRSGRRTTWQTRFVWNATRLARRIFFSGRRADSEWHRLVLDCLAGMLGAGRNFSWAGQAAFPQNAGGTLHDICALVEEIRDVYALRPDGAFMAGECDRVLALANIDQARELEMRRTAAWKDAAPAMPRGDLDAAIEKTLTLPLAAWRQTMSMDAPWPNKGPGDDPPPPPTPAPTPQTPKPQNPSPPSSSSTSSATTSSSKKSPEITFKQSRNKKGRSR